MTAPTATLPEVRWSFTADKVGHDAWSVVGVEGREAISDLARTRVVLLMESGGGGLEALLGKPAKLETHRGGLSRELRGVVAEVEELGTTAQHRLVRVDVVPSLWVLSQRTDCRIFQSQNTLDIVRAVLSSAGLYQGEGELRIDASLDALPPREYCVQYQESDLDFVRRLLEDEGIPFYFAHDGEGGDALVIAADDHVWAEVPTLSTGAIPVLDSRSEMASSESFQWFDERHALRPSSVMVRDFDFTRPRASLDMTGKHGAGARALYEYPARATITGYDSGARSYRVHNTARLAKVRAEEHQTRVHCSRGRGVVTGMMPGRSFALSGHERSELDRRYLVTAVEHHGLDWSIVPEEVLKSPRFAEMLQDAGLPSPEGAKGLGRYGNRVEAHRIEANAATVPFRPERVTPRPIVEGPQTAMVVGPPGEEIHTDEHGRIKVQFHWDRQGRQDDRSSCWIRVAQAMSGGNWGFVFIPRIGMEAVVNFLEGDPDRPLVTACVFNGENNVPYALPENKTRTSVKSWTSPQNGGYNEIRFEDKAGLEQMFTQAQRDHDTLVKNDQTLTVNRHRTKLVQGEEYNTIEKNRVSHVQQNDSSTVDGNRIAEVLKSAMETIAQNKSAQVGQQYTINAGTRFEVNVGKSKLVMDAEGNILLKGVKLAIQGEGNGSLVDVDADLIDLN
jgi:type VI secretion system secreted protein VgrG